MAVIAMVMANAMVVVMVMVKMAMANGMVVMLLAMKMVECSHTRFEPRLGKKYISKCWKHGPC